MSFKTTQTFSYDSVFKPSARVTKRWYINFMLKRCIALFLVFLAPLQAWAVIDMSYMHSSTAVVVESSPSLHPCHQDVKSSNEDVSLSHNQTEESECNSCVLCMSFAHFSHQLPELPIPYALISSVGGVIFVSHQTATPNKPPIL